MPSTPGWVNVLAGGVPGAIAAYDFQTQQYWQQGNPSGGFRPLTFPVNTSTHGLLNSSSANSTAEPVLPLPAGGAGTIVVKVNQLVSINKQIMTATTPTVNLDAATNTTASLTSPTLTATLGSGTFTGGEVVVAISFDQTGRSIVANGGTVVTDATPTGASTQYIFGSTLLNPGGYTLSAVFWPSRLSDSTLQTLSTP